MIEVASVGYGCQWGKDGHVRAWPLRVTIGARGEETTVDEMLEGRGYTVMHRGQLLELIVDMATLRTPIELCSAVELCGDPPVELFWDLLRLGYDVAIVQQ